MNTQTDKLLDFENLKQQIINIITNADSIINQKNCNRESGIYLLYVDNFEDNKIIPFYIGQAVDFQRRFQDHINDVKELVQSGYTEYHTKFFWSAVSNRKLFEGKYRPCKILKYIVDHDCSIDDIRMVILEKCEKENLKEREQYYLSKYLPAFFGFNQIATITEQFTYRNKPEKKQLIIKSDYQNFLKYMEYGYSTFNYLHAFSNYGSDELNKKVNMLVSNHLWPTQEELFSSASSNLDNYQKVYEQTYKIISDKFANSVHDIFSMCKFKSKGREMEVLSAFTNHYHTNIINDVNYNLAYLEYYFNRNKNSKNCGELITALYNEHKDYINKTITPVNIAFKTYINSRTNAIKQSEYSIIFPEKTF